MRKEPMRAGEPGRDPGTFLTAPTNEPSVATVPRTSVNRIVECPDCHRVCGWCAWYAKNARDAGCGAPRRQSKRCEWEALNGTTCETCGGSEKVRLVGAYEPVGPACKREDVSE